MPINKDGIIVPPDKEKKKRRRKEKIKNIVGNIAVIGTIVSVVALGYQKKSYEVQKEYYETYINKLEYDLKKDNPQIRTSYLRCGFTNLNVIYQNDDYKVLSNEISDLYYVKGEKYLENDRDDLKKISGIYDGNKRIISDVIFLNIESFGNRNLNNMVIIADKIIYHSNYDCFFRSFSDLNLDAEEIVTREQKVINLGDRRSGENILIPVALQYEIHKQFNGDIGENIGEDFYVYSLPENTFLYKVVYIPRFIKYYDSITEEEITFEVRDLLENCIETSIFVSEQG